MRYAISNWIYGQEPLRDSFARLARFGYDAIELVGEPGRYSVPEVKALTQEFGVQVTSILTWCIWGIPGRDMAAPNKKERRAALSYGRKCVDLAASFGALVVVVLPAPAGRTSPVLRTKTEVSWKKGRAREWEYAVESIRALAEYAAKHNIVLGLEPINRYETYLIMSLDHALSFLKAVGAANLKIHLDTFHMNLEEPDPAGAIRRAGSLLVNMHVSDSNREAPGRGHMAFEDLLRALREIDYQGVLALEPVPPGADALLAAAMSDNLPLRDRYAEEGIRYLRGLEQRMETAR